MKVVIKENDSHVRLKDLPTPVCKNGDILIEMKACGICRSDLENISGNSCKPSNKLGHEISGRIKKVGKNVKGVYAGQRVFIHHHSHCMNCHFCTHNSETMCDKFLDSLQPCGMSEEFLLPEWNVKKGGIFEIPYSMTFEEASLIEPLGCCIRAWKKFSIQKNDSLAIFGVGPIGAMHALLSKTHGVNTIFCLDINEFRLNFCKQKKIGETIHVNDPSLYDRIFLQTKNRGVDIIIISTNELSIFHKAVDLVRRGGIILFFGEPRKNSKLEFDLEKIYSKEISIMTSYAATNENIAEAFKLVESNKINVKQLITHQFSLNDACKALELASNGKNSMKIVLRSDFP